MTKGFCPCDICGIGLGNFLFKEKQLDGSFKWVKVKGEEKIEWKGGDVICYYMDWVIRNGKSIYQLKKTFDRVRPEKVCPDCEKKYSTAD